MSTERFIAERLVRNRIKERMKEGSEYYTQPEGSWNRDNSDYHKKTSHSKVGKKVKLLHPEDSRQMGRYTIISADDEYVDIQFSPSTTGRYKWEDVKIVESEIVPAPKNYYKQVEDILNYRLGPYERGVKVTDLKIINETPGTITFKVEYDVAIRIPIVDPEDQSTYYEDDFEYRSQTLTIDIEDLDN